MNGVRRLQPAADRVDEGLCNCRSTAPRLPIAWRRTVDFCIKTIVKQQAVAKLLMGLKLVERTADGRLITGWVLQLKQGKR